MGPSPQAQGQLHHAVKLDDNMSGHDSDVKCPAWFNSEEPTVHDSHNGQPFLQSNCDHDDNCSLSRGQKLWFSDNARQHETAFVGAFREVTNRLDLLEVCAPWDSTLSQSVIDQGGKAMRVELHNGFDLSTKAGFTKACHLLLEQRPRYSGTCMCPHRAMLGQLSTMPTNGILKKFNDWKNVGIIVERF